MTMDDTDECSPGLRNRGAGVALSNRDRVGRALEILAKGLEPFVDRHMVTAMPQGRDWLDVMMDRARSGGRPAIMVGLIPGCCCK